MDKLVLEIRYGQPQDRFEIDLDPLQGLWTMEQYLKITDQTNLIEFTDGVLEFLPIPTSRHQAMTRFLAEFFTFEIEPKGGKVPVAPVRLQVGPHRFREPDILMLCDTSDPRYQDAYWLGADIVAEIVSPDRPERDTEEKPRDYAEAGIPEYWIVNPLDETITVLVLDDDTYTTFGVYKRGDFAHSRLLHSLSVPVTDVFDAR